MQAALWLLRSLIIASFRQCSFDGTRTQNKFSQYHKPLEIVDRGPLQLRQQPIQIGSAIMQNSATAGIEAQFTFEVMGNTATDDLIEHPEFAFDSRGDRRQRFLLMPLPKNGQFARHRLEHTDFIGESGGQCHEDHAADAIFPEPPFERPMKEGFPPTDWSPCEK